MILSSNQATGLLYLLGGSHSLLSTQSSCLPDSAELELLEVSFLTWTLEYPLNSHHPDSRHSCRSFLIFGVWLSHAGGSGACHLDRCSHVGKAVRSSRHLSIACCRRCSSCAFGELWKQDNIVTIRGRCLEGVDMDKSYHAMALFLYSTNLHYRRE